jgi:DNA-binding XRE family transcriptional regulator
MRSFYHLSLRRIINQINNTTQKRKTQDKKEVTPLEQIRVLREAAGLSQTELANRLGVKPCAVSLMEKPGRFPDVSRLPAIADALGCTTDALFGREGPRQP